AGTLSADEVLPQMAEAATRGVGAQAARVTLILPGGGERSTVWPLDVSGVEFTRALQVSYRGERVGELAVRESPGRPITPAAGRLDALTDEMQRTLDGLRELARGIFPPLLADKGIVAALHAYARKSALPATIDIPDDLTTTRFDPGIEAAVYFCCIEALRAVDGPASVRLSSSDGALTFTIDGVALLDG